jgi:catechol-2,3-dioxygenase
MSDLITKLLPILHVRDPGAERSFYKQLGLRTTYQGPEYPDFVAVGNDVVEFGLSRSGTDVGRRRRHEVPRAWLHHAHRDVVAPHVHPDLR